MNIKSAAIIAFMGFASRGQAATCDPLFRGRKIMLSCPGIMTDDFERAPSWETCKDWKRKILPDGHTCAENSIEWDVLEAINFDTAGLDPEVVRAKFPNGISYDELCNCNSPKQKKEPEILKGEDSQPPDGPCEGKRREPCVLNSACDWFRNGRKSYCRNKLGDYTSIGQRGIRSYKCPQKLYQCKARSYYGCVDEANAQCQGVANCVAFAVNKLFVKKRSQRQAILYTDSNCNKQNEVADKAWDLYKSKEERVSDVPTGGSNCVDDNGAKFASGYESPPKYSLENGGDCYVQYKSCYEGNWMSSIQPTEQEHCLETPTPSGDVCTPGKMEFKGEFVRFSTGADNMSKCPELNHRPMYVTCSEWKQCADSFATEKNDIRFALETDSLKMTIDDIFEVYPNGLTFDDVCCNTATEPLPFFPSSPFVSYNTGGPDCGPRRWSGETENFESNGITAKQYNPTGIDGWEVCEYGLELVEEVGAQLTKTMIDGCGYRSYNKYECACMDDPKRDCLDLFNEYDQDNVCEIAEEWGCMASCGMC